MKNAAGFAFVYFLVTGIVCCIIGFATKEVLCWPIALICFGIGITALFYDNGGDDL